MMNFSQVVHINVVSGFIAQQQHQESQFSIIPQQYIQLNQPSTRAINVGLPLHILILVAILLIYISIQVFQISIQHLCRHQTFSHFQRLCAVFKHAKFWILLAIFYPIDFL